jgi:hypothetical protein
LGEKAAPLWLLAKNKIFSCKDTWEAIRKKKGAGLFGILFLSLSMLSFYGLHLKID